MNNLVDVFDVDDALEIDFYAKPRSGKSPLYVSLYSTIEKTNVTTKDSLISDDTIEDLI